MMLNGLFGVSLASEAMSDDTLERNRAEKALITKTPTHVQYNKTKNYSDKNGNDVTKAVHQGRKTFAFWALACLLFILAIGNLVLTFTIFTVCRLCQGLESMEFLPEQNAIKFFGRTDLDHVYKRDGLLESFKDEPMKVSSENGSVVFNLQTRQSRSDTRMTVNTTGVFINGVGSLALRDPATGALLFSTAPNEGYALPDAVNNLQARQISTKRITSPIDENLDIQSDASMYLKGAEGTRMESKELTWTADQDIHIKSINGSVVLSGKEGVYIDVRNLPIVKAVTDRQDKQTGQFKICVCMPQGKLFKIAVIDGQKVTCSHVNMTKDMNPCA